MGRPRKASVSSIGEKEEKLAESVMPVTVQGAPQLTTHFDKTQRKISNSMLNVLAIQGKQGLISNFSLRMVSIISVLLF